MFIRINKRYQDPQTSEGGEGSPGDTEAIGDTSTPASSAPAATGNIEIPDFSELADWDESLIIADDDAPAESGSGAPTQQTPAAQPSGDSTPPETPAPAADSAAEVPPTPPADQAAQAPAPSAEPAPQEPPAAQEPPTTIEQHRERALPELQKLYQLTQEEADELNTNLVEALPKLAAKLHFEVVMSAYQAVQSRLPEMIQGFMLHDRQVQEANNAFYAKWPDLKGDAHVEKVRNAIKAYKAANPQATREEIINGAGAMVMISMGKNPFASAPSQAQPSVPSAPARPVGIGATGAPMPASASEPANEIEALSQAWASGEID